MHDFYRAIRLIYIMCNNDTLAKLRVMEMLNDLEYNAVLTPLEWIDYNTPLVDRVLH